MAELNVTCTLEPSQYIRNLYKKTYTSEKSNTPEEYTPSVLYFVLSSDGAEKGVIGISCVSDKLWNAHIAAESPLLGEDLRTLCKAVMHHAKECGVVDSVICCPKNTLATRLVKRLGFRKINQTPLIYFRDL